MVFVVGDPDGCAQSKAVWMSGAVLAWIAVILFFKSVARSESWWDMTHPLPFDMGLTLRMG